MKSEVVLAFHRDKERFSSPLEQLGHDITGVTLAGKHSIDLIVCNKQDWTEIEAELFERIQKRYGGTLGLHGYDKIGTVKGESYKPTHRGGWNCLVYRGLPIVAISDNPTDIISARLYK